MQVVQLLHHQANELLHSSYSEKTGKALLGAVAQACWLIGFMAEDVGRHALAQRYYIQGLNLAMAGGDRLYAGYLLSQMGRMTVQIGHGALTEQDWLRNAARSSCSPAPGSALSRAPQPTCW